jgi:hypothetical protein
MDVRISKKNAVWIRLARTNKAILLVELNEIVMKSKKIPPLYVEMFVLKVNILLEKRILHLCGN